MDFTFEHPDAASEWHQWSNTLVILSVPDEPALIELADRLALGAWDSGRDYVRFTTFYEPDLDDALTAIALEPDAHRMVRRLPLALNGPREEVTS